MTEQAQYRDPRLVILYDRLNRWGADDDFFLALANETPSSRHRTAPVTCSTSAAAPDA